MLASGVAPKVAAERLGHADPTLFTNLYGHVTPTMQRDAATKIGFNPTETLAEDDFAFTLEASSGLQLRTLAAFTKSLAEVSQRAGRLWFAEGPVAEKPCLQWSF